jgi:O-antigen ligase
LFLPQRRHPPRHFGQWPLYATIAFIMACFVLGGSSRADVVQHALLRPLAIILAVAIIGFAPRIDWRAIRWPGGLLLALAVLMVLQLVPLPYAWWAGLPGRDLARSAVSLIDAQDPAHGLSLTPDRTLNSLFSLTVPAATLLAMAALDPRQRRIVLPWLLGGMAASMLLGFLQLVQGRLYLYEVTNLGSAVGFFANRNHNAALIAASLPLLACLATWPVHKPATRPVLWLVSGGTMVLALLAVFAIGSRWGLAVAAVGLLWALLVARRELGQWLGRYSKPVRIALSTLPLVLVAGLVVIAALGSRDETLRRLFEMTVTEDLRLQSLPVTMAMMRELFPIGSGFGSFEAMYRIAEPRSLLSLQYLNHVHNDYVEVAIDAGIAGLALLAVAMGWFAVRTIKSFARRASADDMERRMARAAGGVALIAALASIADYPVRTPIWMMVLAICAVWLAGIAGGTVPESNGSSAGERASSRRDIPRRT